MGFGKPNDAKMTAAAYLETIRDANPAIFAARTVQMSPAALEKAIRYAFEAGVKSAAVDPRADRSTPFWPFTEPFNTTRRNL